MDDDTQTISKAELARVFTGLAELVRANYTPSSLLDLFKQHDRRGTNFLSVEHFIDCLKEISPILVKEEIYSVYQEFYDIVDGDELVNYTKFIERLEAVTNNRVLVNQIFESLISLASQGNGNLIVKLKKAGAENNGGNVTLIQVEQAVKELGRELTSDEIKALKEQYESEDQQGCINVEKLEKSLREYFKKAGVSYDSLLDATKFKCN